MSDITLAISGMSCGHCLNSVNRAVTGLEGVTVKSVQIGRAELGVDSPEAADRARAAIERAGYRVEGTVGA